MITPEVCIQDKPTVYGVAVMAGEIPIVTPAAVVNLNARFAGPGAAGNQFNPLAVMVAAEIVMVSPVASTVQSAELNAVVPATTPGVVVSQKSIEAMPFISWPTVVMLMLPTVVPLPAAREYVSEATI